MGTQRHKARRNMSIFKRKRNSSQGQFRFSAKTRAPIATMYFGKEQKGPDLVSIMLEKMGFRTGAR